MIWFTADTHFGDEVVRSVCKRPFSTVEQMDRALVNNINALVGLKDELYILGDFANYLTGPEQLAVREAIFCERVHLVPGNHDRDWSRPLPEAAGWEPFILEPPIAKLKLDRAHGARRLILCHYPIMDWEGLGQGWVHLHGHIHATSEYNARNRELGLLRYDVGMDANDFLPVSLDEVLSYFDGVEARRRVDWHEWLAMLPYDDGRGEE